MTTTPYRSADHEQLTGELRFIVCRTVIKLMEIPHMNSAIKMFQADPGLQHNSLKAKSIRISPRLPTRNNPFRFLYVPHFH